jgi:hypothetical protein
MRPPRRPSSWLEDFPRRLTIQQPAFAAYPGLSYRRQQRPEGTVYVYRAKLDVPGTNLGASASSSTPVGPVPLGYSPTLPQGARTHPTATPSEDAAACASGTQVTRLSDVGCQTTACWHCSG